MKNKKPGTDGSVVSETGVFPDNSGGGIEFQPIWFRKREKNKLTPWTKITGLQQAHWKKRWKKPRKRLEFPRTKLCLSRIMMCWTHGSVQVFSLSLLWDGQTLSTKITKHSSRTKCLKQAKIFYSFGSQEWSWCHFGWLTRLLSRKCYSIL